MEWILWGSGTLPTEWEVVGWGDPSQRGRESKSHPAGKWAQFKELKLTHLVQRKKERREYFPGGEGGRKPDLVGNGAGSWGTFRLGSSYAVLTLWGLRVFHLCSPHNLLQSFLCIWLHVSVHLWFPLLHDWLWFALVLHSFSAQILHMTHFLLVWDS